MTMRLDGFPVVRGNHFVLRFFGTPVTHRSFRAHFMSTPWMISEG